MSLVATASCPIMNPNAKGFVYNLSPSASFLTPPSLPSPPSPTNPSAPASAPAVQVKMISLLNIAEVDDILLIIQEFVPINALLLSSKQLALLKRRYFRWNLTPVASQRYYQSQPFRDILLSLMTYPRKQLHIKLSGCSEVTDVSMLGNVHTLDLSCCSNVRDVSMLGNVHTLNLSYCSKVTDVSMLGNVQTLT